MQLIQLQTFINAPVKIVFDLSRSVDLHKASMIKHKEEIIDGVNAGLMTEGDTVTWKAKHLFKSRTLKVRITKLDSPRFFEDEIITGDFKTMRHEHFFEEKNGGTVMKDNFSFESPFGFIGKLVDLFYLRNYMTRLLSERNNEIKQIAESNLWKQFLIYE